MIRTDNSECREKLASQATKPPLHPVSNHRIADFLGHGESDPQGTIAVIAVPNLEDEAGHGEALAAVGGKEIRPLAKDD